MMRSAMSYAVIRETIRSLDKVALAGVVLTNREHVIALEARDNGLMGMLLPIPTRYATLANISTTFKTSRSPTTCWTLPNTSSNRSPAISIPTNLRIITRRRCRNCSPRSKRACRSRRRAGQ